LFWRAIFTGAVASALLLLGIEDQHARLRGSTSPQVANTTP